MAQCERTVSRHSRPIRHALASTSLGPLKYLKRSLSISLSLSSLCTHLIGCLLLTCTVCVVYVPSGRLPSLSADEKSGSSLWITRRPFAFFFAWHSGTVMKCGPIYYGNKNSDFTTRRWLSILFADARLDAHNYRINNLSMEIFKSVDAAMESGRAFSLAI